MTDKTSLEVANRLKEKGFPQTYDGYYWANTSRGYELMRVEDTEFDPEIETEHDNSLYKAPTIGELHAVVTDDDIANFLIEKIFFRGDKMPGITVSEILRSADLLAEVWMWKKETTEKTGGTK